MKTLWMVTLLILATGLSAQNCVKNARGKTVCSNGTTTAAVNPNTGKAAVAQTNQNSATVKTSSGTTTKAAVNPYTGKAAAAQTNQNGVTTTKTSTGTTAKTKNGKGVATGPGGTVCRRAKQPRLCHAKVALPQHIYGGEGAGCQTKRNPRR